MPGALKESSDHSYPKFTEKEMETLGGEVR